MTVFGGTVPLSVRSANYRISNDAYVTLAVLFVKTCLEECCHVVLIALKTVLFRIPRGMRGMAKQSKHRCRLCALKHHND